MRIRRTVPIVVLGLLIFCFICTTIVSASDDRATVQTGNTYIAPFSQEYNEWLCQKYANYPKSQEGHGLDLIPSPVDISGASGSCSWSTDSTVNSPFTVALNMPVSSPSVQTVAANTVGSSSGSFDLRTQGKLTPIKNQGQDGNCWAFASLASLESSLMPVEVTDFSENNEKNLHGFDVATNLGGNDFMATAYFARWAGPVVESADPYSDGSTVSMSGLAPEKHVQEVLFIPARTGALENDQIKDIIREYGAVYSTIRYVGSSYNPSNAAYYYSDSASPNHAIDLVGWDDNYDKSNFNNPPPGNGAFIARNSWGSTWGDGGYFYISYYDSRVGRDNAMFTAQAPNNYNRVYQYDPLGWVTNFGLGTDTAYYANIFTATGNEQLKAVGLYTTATNTAYEVKIFLNPDQGPVSSGGFVSTRSGTMGYAGYHTLTLTTPVNLKAGDRFSVAVKVVSPGWNFPVAIEYPISGYTSKATASPGQSYISGDGSGWSDLTSSQANTNVCLKAFTTSGSSTVTTTKITNPYGINISKTTVSTSTFLKNLAKTQVLVKSSTPQVFTKNSFVNATIPTVSAGQVFVPGLVQNRTSGLEGSVFAENYVTTVLGAEQNLSGLASQGTPVGLTGIKTDPSKYSIF